MERNYNFKFMQSFVSYCVNTVPFQDQQIIDEKQNYTISGGCAVIVALFLLGKLYIANAGDCRLVYIYHIR